MSVRSNGSGDNLAVASSLGITTDDFSFGCWVYLIADRNDFSSFMGFGDVASDPTTYVAFGTHVDGTTVALYSSTLAGGEINSTFSMSTATWYWIVASRAGTTMRIRVFDDSTSTTPLADQTGTDGSDYSALDNLLISQLDTIPDWTDGEFQNAKVHIGVAWTDAECRTESQNYEIQTAGGTKWGSWRLKDVDADTDGLNDNSGNARNLTNTGLVAGANTPTQLAPTKPMFRGQA